MAYRCDTCKFMSDKQMVILGDSFTCDTCLDEIGLDVSRMNALNSVQELIWFVGGLPEAVDKEDLHNAIKNLVLIETHLKKKVPFKSNSSPDR